MTVYLLNVKNTTDIANKELQLQDRIGASLEITVTLNSLTYASNQLTFTFASALSGEQVSTLNNLVDLIVEGDNIAVIYPIPRTIVSTRIPNFLCDSLNGNNVGDIGVIGNDMYVCTGNSIDDASWNLQINTLNVTSSPTNMTFSENGQPYMTSVDTTEKTATALIYDGSFTDTITEFSVVGSITNFGNGIASLVIPGAPNTVIATVNITTGSKSQPVNFSTTTISNLPFAQTVLKVVFNWTSGVPGDEVNIFSARIKY